MGRIPSFLGGLDHGSLRKTLFVVALGQLVSFLMALNAFSSSYLASLGVNAPLTQSFFTYFSLTAIYGSIMLFRGQKLMVPWYYYAPLGFVDVQGNYFVIKAFQFRSITSVTLFDCWTIPWVMVLTYIFIGTRYSIRQFSGAAICIIGLVLVLFSDSGVGGGVRHEQKFVTAEDNSLSTWKNHQFSSWGVWWSRPLLGDFLVIGGTLFYALSNVGEEFCVKQKDLVEVILMLGVFGLLVSICEIAILERHTLLSIEWSPHVILAFAGFASVSVLFYTLLPFLLKLSGSTLFNLSALTSDMWAVLIRIFFYHQEVGWLYYVSFSIVAVGLVIYSISESESTATSSADGHSGGEYQVLAEGCTESGGDTLVA